MKKSKVFKTEIEYIKDSRYKENAYKLLDILPDYFYEIPASSTGKYHPKYTLGDGGLVRHTKVAVTIAHTLLCNNTIGSTFTLKEQDLMLIALMVHDGLKEGLPKGKYTVHDHPIQVSNFIKSNKDKLDLNEEEINFITTVIESHMGEWNKSDYSDVVLPLPQNKYQKFVHMCDYLASRKFLNVEFEGNEIIK